MNLLKIRMQKKRKKPDFLRQNWFRLKRLGKKWRAPKGNQNKLRRHFFGRGHIPSVGYSSPSIVRGLHPSGLKEVLVSNVSEIESLDQKTECARISVTVGRKKRVQIIESAKKKNIRVLNPRVLNNKKPDDEKQIAK